MGKEDRLYTDLYLRAFLAKINDKIFQNSLKIPFWDYF